jgi:hypothetical protein
MGQASQRLSLMSLRKADFQRSKVVRHCDLKPLGELGAATNNIIATTNLFKP